MKGVIAKRTQLKMKVGSVRPQVRHLSMRKGKGEHRNEYAAWKETTVTTGRCCKEAGACSLVTTGGRKLVTNKCAYRLYALVIPAEKPLSDNHVQ